MRSATRKVQKWILDAVQSIAALEYTLVETFYAAASSASGFVAAAFSTRAGAAQVHLFDLGTALREMGDESLNYARCARQSLVQYGNADELLRRLERECRRIVEHKDVPDGLRVLLRANLAEHRGLAPARPLQLASAAN